MWLFAVNCVCVGEVHIVSFETGASIPRLFFLPDDLCDCELEGISSQVDGIERSKW